MLQCLLFLNMKVAEEVQYTDTTQYNKVALYLAFPLFPHCNPHLSLLL